MSRRDIVFWECDRCEFRITLPQKESSPVGWVGLIYKPNVSYGLNHSLNTEHHLCDKCAEESREFMAGDR